MKLNKKGYMLVEIIVAFALVFSIAMYLLNLTLKFKDTNEDIYYSAKYLKDKNLITRNIMEDISRGIIEDIQHEAGENVIKFTIYIDDQEEKKEYRKLLIFNDSGFGIEYGKINESGDFEKSDVSYYKKKLEQSLIIDPNDIDIESDATANMFNIQIPINSLYTDETYNITILGILGKVYEPVWESTKTYTNYYPLLAILEFSRYQEYINGGGWKYKTSTSIPALNINKSLNIPRSNNNIDISYVCLTKEDGNTDHCVDYEETKTLQEFYKNYIEIKKGTSSYFEKYEKDTLEDGKIATSIYTDPSNIFNKYILHSSYSEIKDEIETEELGTFTHDISEIQISDLIDASVFTKSIAIQIEGKTIGNIENDLKTKLVNNNFKITVDRNVTSQFNNNVSGVEISRKNNGEEIDKIDAILSPIMFKITYDACER